MINNDNERKDDKPSGRWAGGLADLLRVGKAIGCAEARGASVERERERCASLRSAHPMALSKKNLFVLLTGFVMYSLAVKECLLPSNNHSGRWAWLFNAAIEVFGVYGSMYL